MLLLSLDRITLSPVFAASAARKIFEPVPKNRGGCGSGRDILPNGPVGQLGAQAGPAFEARASLEIRKSLFGLGVEILRGDGRIAVALAGEKARDVAQIFPLQRECVIFRMTLEEDELAAELFRKDIDPGFRRSGQQLIAPGGEVAGAQLVEAGM